VAVIAVPIEALALRLLAYAPQKGVPRNPDPGLRFWGSFSALFHAPALLLNDFVCRRVHMPGFLLWADIIVFGYALTVLILSFAWRMIGARKMSLP
jgi:hypothetical protein